MNERPQTLPPASYDDEIDLREILRVLWDGKWLIGGITLAASSIAVIYALMLPNIYRAEALLAPNEHEGAVGLSALAAEYGGLASLAGIKLETGFADKTAIGLEILNSRTFISEFIVRHDNLVPLMAEKGWDEATRAISIDDDIYDTRTSKWAQTRNTEVRTVDLARILAGDSVADLPLQPYDILNIKEVPPWRDVEIVSIEAEVRFPGRFPLRRGERLSSMLERAGGLTDSAFAKGADESIDVEFRDGDRLLVPRQSQTVTIIGEVQYPTAHTYEPGILKNEYINLNGRMTRLADNNRAYAVRADGSILASNSSRFFRRRDSDDIGPGDTIVVPLKPDPISSLSLWTSVTSIIYNIVVAAAAVAAF